MHPKVSGTLQSKFQIPLGTWFLTERISKLPSIGGLKAAEIDRLPQFFAAARALAESDAVTSSILQVQAFHRRQLDPFFRRIIRGVVHEPDQPPAGGIDIKNVDAAWILLEGAEAVEIDPQSVGQNGSVHPAMSHQEQVLPPGIGEQLP